MQATHAGAFHVPYSEDSNDLPLAIQSATTLEVMAAAAPIDHNAPMDFGAMLDAYSLAGALVNQARELNAMFALVREASIAAPCLPRCCL